MTFYKHGMAVDHQRMSLCKNCDDYMIMTNCV